jgi:hypothetical protein
MLSLVFNTVIKAASIAEIIHNPLLKFFLAMMAAFIILQNIKESILLFIFTFLCIF